MLVIRYYKKKKEERYERWNMDSMWEYKEL